MTCSGCGLHSCEGDCYSQCPSDYPDEPQPVFTPKTLTTEEVEGYREWLASIDRDGGSDPLISLEPKRRAA